VKILVTTPTGQIGRQIVQELLAPEFSVRVIVRDPGRLPDEVREQVEIVRGSTENVATLREALDGVEALFWCVPAESLQETKVQRHYERFACTAWHVIREARTPRVVTISAGGKGFAHKTGRISGLHAMEEILNECGVAIRHLRCGLFMENFLGQIESLLQRGIFSHTIPGNIPVPMVAVNDIADVALKWLVRRDWDGIAAVPVHGPQDLSYGDVAAIFGRVLGKSVRYEQWSVEHFAKMMVNLGTSVDYARSIVEMHAAFAQDVTRAEPRVFESTTRTTFAEWAESEFLPAFESRRAQREIEAAFSERNNKHHIRPFVGI